MPTLYWVELLPLCGALEHTGSRCQSQKFTLNTFTSCLGDNFCTGMCLRLIKCCVHSLSHSHPHSLPPCPPPVYTLLSGWCLNPFLSPHITSQLETALLNCKKNKKKNLVLQHFFGRGASQFSTAPLSHVVELKCSYF